VDLNGDVQEGSSESEATELFTCGHTLVHKFGVCRGIRTYKSRDETHILWSALLVVEPVYVDLTDEYKIS